MGKNRDWVREKVDGGGGGGVGVDRSKELEKAWKTCLENEVFENLVITGKWLLKRKISENLRSFPHTKS